MVRFSFKTKRWRALRDQVFRRDDWVCQWPGCGVTVRKGRGGHKAAVCDHKIPRRVRPDLAWDIGNLWTLCRLHHDQSKLEQERKGFSTDIGIDGKPVDPRHPANVGFNPDGAWGKRHGFSIPAGLQPSGIPVTVVCGPPAAGKTSWVRKRARTGDVVIDFDQLRQELGGRRYDQRPGVKRKAMTARAAMLHGLAQRSTGKAWFIVTAPTHAERAAWLDALGPMATLKVIRTKAETCRKRIKADPQRREVRSMMLETVDRWHDADAMR